MMTSIREQTVFIFFVYEIEEDAMINGMLISGFQIFRRKKKLQSRDSKD